jgi:hypothetical protein
MDGHAVASVDVAFAIEVGGEFIKDKGVTFVLYRVR